MTKKVIIISASALILVIILLFIRQNYLKNNVDYQIKMMNQGTTEEKIRAFSFLSHKKILSIIPTLIENIDNQESAHWDGDPKGGVITASCVASLELEILTGNKFGRFCYYDIGEEKNEEVVKQKWRDWYKNDYAKWLQEQQK